MRNTIYISIIMLVMVPISVIGQKKTNLEGILIGNYAPEIALPTLSGDTVCLSSLEGKLVLINFWASWCVPCRKKSPDLLEINDDFAEVEFKGGEKGFELYSVSLDRNEMAWRNAVTKDGVEDFINVGDMEAWKSKTATRYNIKSIPTNVLLDGSGKIIATNLNPKDLKKKLRKLKKSSWGWL